MDERFRAVERGGDEKAYEVVLVRSGVPSRDECKRRMVRALSALARNRKSLTQALMNAWKSLPVEDRWPMIIQRPVDYITLNFENTEPGDPE